jgi:hypothetical protein
MAGKINKHNNEGLEISVGRVVGGIVRGIGNLFGFAVNLEKRGESGYEEIGEIQGKTETGKEYRAAYGVKMKLGINPEELGEKR